MKQIRYGLWTNFNSLMSYHILNGAQIQAMSWLALQNVGRPSLSAYLIQNGNARLMKAWRVWSTASGLQLQGMSSLFLSSICGSQCGQWLINQSNISKDPNTVATMRQLEVSNSLQTRRSWPWSKRTWKTAKMSSACMISLIALIQIIKAHRTGAACTSSTLKPLMHRIWCSRKMETTLSYGKVH